MNVEEMYNTMKICAATAYANGLTRAQFMGEAEKAFREACPMAPDDEAPKADELALEVTAYGGAEETVALADAEDTPTTRRRR